MALTPEQIASQTANSTNAAANLNKGLNADGTPVVAPTTPPANGNFTTPSGATVNGATGALVTQPPTSNNSNGTSGNAPTVGSIYSDANDPYSASAIDAAEKADSDFATNGLSDTDQAAIRSQTLASFQAEIDAQNQIYADKLAQAKVAGANRLGTTTASEARGGELGSTFGEAQTDTTNAGNQSVYSGIQDEQNAAISAIQNQANTAATQAIANKTSAKQAGLDSYVKYLSDASTRASTNATTAANLLVTKGIDPSTLSSDQLNSILNGYGITSDALTNAYSTAKKTADAAATKASQDAQAAADQDAIAKATVTKDGETTLAPGQTLVDSNGQVLTSIPKDLQFSTVNNGDGTTSVVALDPTTGKQVGTVSTGSGSVTSGGTYTPGQNPVVDGWVQNVQSGKATLANVPKNLQNAVSQGLAATSGQPNDILKTTQQSLQELQDMVNKNHGFTASVGYRGLLGTFTGPIAGSNAAGFAAKAVQTVNDVVLPNLTLLHGLGRITDKEFQALTSAVTSLNINTDKGSRYYGTSPLSESDFKTELTSVINQINALAAPNGNTQTTGAGNTGSGSGDTTLMVGPDNVQYNVPNANVAAFTAAGGKMVQ